MFLSSLPAQHLCLKVGKVVRHQHDAVLWMINTLWCVLKMEIWSKPPSLLQVIIRREAQSLHFLCVFVAHNIYSFLELSDKVCPRWMLEGQITYFTILH